MPSGTLPLLLVDGGGENNNLLVDNFINQKGIRMKKLVAMLDINVSNSMVEAQNKLIKYNYLFRLHREFPSIEFLRKHLDWSIKDYNHKRPHGSLPDYQTPFEAYSGNNPDMLPIKQGFQQAKRLRSEQNTKERCEGIC